MPGGVRRASAAQSVREYIDSHPSVRDAMVMGIVNLSALTRKIMSELGIRQEEAVLMACRRYEAQGQATSQDAILRVVQRSKLEMQTHMAIITMRPSWQTYGRLEKAVQAIKGRNAPMHFIRGSESVTIITDEGLVESVLEALGREDLIKVRTGLVEVNLRSPEVVEEVPGIVAFITSRLYERGVNLVEVISCYKDTMLVLEQGDLVRAYDLLLNLIGGRLKSAAEAS